MSDDANLEPQKPLTKLQLFVKAKGLKNTARALGVGDFSVYHYLRGTRLMRKKKRQKLIDFAAGELCEADIDQHYETVRAARADGGIYK